MIHKSLQYFRHLNRIYKYFSLSVRYMYILKKDVTPLNAYNTAETIEFVGLLIPPQIVSPSRSSAPIEQAKGHYTHCKTHLYHYK